MQTAIYKELVYERQKQGILKEIKTSLRMEIKIVEWNHFIKPHHHQLWVSNFISVSFAIGWMKKKYNKKGSQHLVNKYI